MEKVLAVRQTRNLLRMGLLRSVRGLSWGLSGGVTVAIVVGRARGGGNCLRRIAAQFKMVPLFAVITRLLDWTLHFTMFKLA